MQKKSNNDIAENQIHSGYHKSKDHVKSLIEASTVAYDNNQYPNSILLSILAVEELSKLHLITNHLKKFQGIPYSEWYDFSKKGGMHKRRLSHIPKTSRENMQKKPKEFFDSIKNFYEQIGHHANVTYEQIMRLDENYEKQFEFYDKIKQLCMYLHWNGEKWFTIEDLLNKTELQAIAYELLTDVDFNFKSLIFVKIHDKISSNITKTLQTEPDFQVYLDALTKRQSSEYWQMKIISINAIYHINSLKLDADKNVKTKSQ